MHLKSDFGFKKNTEPSTTIKYLLIIKKYYYEFLIPI